MRQAYDKGLHQFFKLQTTFTTSSMVLFDANGCMRKYEDVREIMREFFDLRFVIGLNIFLKFNNLADYS
jgi:DNA topoisomerase-2